jgi:hypothetical protein
LCSSGESQNSGRRAGSRSTRKPVSQFPLDWCAAVVRFADPTKQISRFGFWQKNQTLAWAPVGDARIRCVPAGVRRHGDGDGVDAARLSVYVAPQGER